VATDIVDRRLEAASRFGADVALSYSEDVFGRLRQLNDGRLADVVIACTGVESALVQALGAVERGGTVLLFAPANPGIKLPVSFNELFWRNDRTVTTSYAGSPADYATALELLRGGVVQVRDMITHRLSLAEAFLGFQLVASAGDSLKVIILPQK
jgi:L-iditol 2-dehydrogenase